MPRPARSWNTSAPPSLSRGQTNRVALIGEELRARRVCGRLFPRTCVSATLVEPSRDGQATFDVKVARDAPLGLYGLRVATRSGLSNVKLFLIDDLPVVNERRSSSGNGIAPAPEPARGRSGQSR